MADGPAEYRLAPESVRDMESVWLYTLEHRSRSQADNCTDGLVQVFRQLANSPKLGTACDHIRQGYRHRHVGRHVVYRERDYGIVVIRVLHDRMLPTQNL